MFLQIIWTHKYGFSYMYVLYFIGYHDCQINVQVPNHQVLNASKALEHTSTYENLLYCQSVQLLSQTLSSMSF